MAIFFTSAISAPNYPTCGFDGNFNGKEGTLYNSSVVSGASAGSPDGNPVLRTAYIAGATIDGSNVQHDFGVGNNGIDTTPTQGMELFIRGMFRWRNHYPVAADAVLGGKFNIVGNAAGHEGVSRVIFNISDNGSTFASTAVILQRNIDGGSRFAVTDQAWHTYQLAIKSSTNVKTPSSTTRSGTTATVVCTAHGFSNGASVETQYVSGTEASQEFLYYGVHTITVLDANTFTYTVSASAPATATATHRLMTADAVLRTWVDSMVLGSPVLTQSGLGLSVEDWSGGQLRYGGFIGFEGSVPGTVWTPAPIFDLGTFQTGDTFDAAWGGGGGGGTVVPVFVDNSRRQGIL